MKKMLLTLAVLICAIGVQAQKISNIESTKSWYYIYDDNGKKIKAVSTSIGELKGYSANFYVIQQGSWIYTFDPTGKKLHTFAVSSVGEILSVTDDSFTTRKGSRIYIWSKEGKKIGTRAANH